ncbi:hypothetical protein BAUCODRAFT_67965 [Baudoinia panamericana UAMH 10762]|uniref:Uncharacterized protein n=1 Tax=Baudoinia panamericana (strain UAMH 10762) TaxID=717646 RepID=M2LS96_BAUPA|nr:uncharacterized protein BAUCODRAFT_67965 [Baudoinia panamericana UAMH 10762]EMC97347.1 hypothetical protein BAUCODRAFT_67965 [Baudoinia panamericana UAMH 10762]
MVLNVQKPSDPQGLIIEAWAQGFMVGSLVIMACITAANMRRKVLLHKLILVELIFGMFHGTFIFTDPPVYNWYLSVTAIFLNVSWSLHNVIAWIKNKPLLPRWASIFYITTVILVQPYWVLELAANFLYFSDTNNLFVYTRPYEALFRDPWWIFTALNLFWNIKTRYDFGVVELIRVSPRFGVLLGSMLVSICFIVVDILAVTHVVSGPGLPDGINPFWKIAFVFKCLTDTIILDDFKTALDRLKQYRLERMGSVLSDNIRGDFQHVDYTQRKKVDGSQEMRGIPAIQSRDWTKVTDFDNLDLETALRVDLREHAESSSPSGG